MRRHLGRGVAHHQRHDAALAATGIHHALNARLVRALAQHNQAPGLDDRGLLPRNGLERIAQNTCVIEPNARNGNGNGIGRTRSIQRPPMPTSSTATSTAASANTTSAAAVSRSNGVMA